MANIEDYIMWRGDVKFEVSPYNEVDSLICARISYFPLKYLMRNDEIVSLNEIATRFVNSSDVKVLWPEDQKAIPLISLSNRFGEVKVVDFIDSTEKNIDKQFAAVTILLPNDEIYVSFRGTDATVVGWKEDFTMSYLDHIPGQLEAKEYLEEVTRKYKGAKIHVGGHSKGGHLAMYAAAFAEKDVKDRIIEVVNFDGPGFSKKVLETEEYNSILDITTTYLPKSSVFGRLMYHKEKSIIVESNEKLLMQHDIYSWQIQGRYFVKSNQLSESSIVINNAVNDFLEKTTPEKREITVDALFDILYSMDIEKIKDLKVNLFENVKFLVKSYGELDEEIRDVVNQVVTGLIKSASESVKMQTISKLDMGKKDKNNLLNS